MFLHNTQWNCFCNHVFQWREEKYCNLPNIEREMLGGGGGVIIRRLGNHGLFMQLIYFGII